MRFASIPCCEMRLREHSASPHIFYSWFIWGRFVAVRGRGRKGEGREKMAKKGRGVVSNAQLEQGRRQGLGAVSVLTKILHTRRRTFKLVATLSMP